MRDEALFLNGVFEAVLAEILEVQEQLPEQIMFLQPHSSRAIVNLRELPPTLDDPVQLLISTTTELPTVQYTAEIVGWDDKLSLSDEKRHVLSRIIWTLQPREGGLYDLSKVPNAKSANLLHVRRLRKLQEPFEVSRLVKTNDGTPVSPDRTTAGGWSYVCALEVA